MVEAMIVEQGKGREVIIRYRDENDVRKVIKDNDHWPYAFVTDESAKWIQAVRKEAGYEGLYGEDLTKIVVSHPEQLRAIKDVGPTWEGNIPFVNRVLTDRINEGMPPIPNYNHRVWYMDCEWSPDTSEMRIIVVYDSYTEREYVWFIHPDYEAGKYSKVGDYEYETHAMCFADEKTMLEHFINHMKRCDPDIITGWFVVGADIKTIAERCRSLGINPGNMSPMRRFRWKFGDWEQPIVGRNCIDLMIGFSKIWEMKNGKLPGYRLDDVALECLKESKVALEDGHDTYYSDLPLYLHYARQDVRLLPKLNSLVNAIEYYCAIQHIVQCDLRSTPFVTKLFTSLSLVDEKFDERIPTKPQFDYRPYSGAEVMEVESGMHRNMGILDIRAMYHSNAELHNISWDTLDPEGKDCGNGTCFRQGDKGLLVRQMDKMTNLRNHYKKMMKDDPDNYDKWDTMQFACKTLVASMYGAAGDSKYGLYHPDVAQAITYTSRQTLGRLKELANEEGLTVRYGHTDSVFCEIPDPDVGLEAVSRINEKMFPIITEFEKWCESMVIMAKNRYAGITVWTDGEYHEPTLYVKGIELKQSRMPPVMKEAMKETLGAMLSGRPELAITNNLTSLIDDIVSGECAIQELCMKGKLEKSLKQYKVLSGPSAGAMWANEHLGKGYGAGSYFLVTINDEGKYVAFDDPKDIEGITKVGFRTLASKFVVDKVLPYYNVMKWDVQPLYNALNGLSKIQWV
jgi:DNA polymerase elongation subunit (family B)